MMYLLHPGLIRSKNDGQLHYVSARRLADLYGVPLRQCEVCPDPRSSAAHGWKRPECVIDLYPNYHGDYTLPQPSKDSNT
jgi:hypothetical protein